MNRYNHLVTMLNDAKLAVTPDNLPRLRADVTEALNAAAVGYGDVRYAATVDEFKIGCAVTASRLFADDTPQEVPVHRFGPPCGHIICESSGGTCLFTGKTTAPTT